LNYLRNTIKNNCLRLIRAKESGRLTVRSLLRKRDPYGDGDGIKDAPTAAEIRATLERVIASPGFRRSPQLVGFLRFVVESALDGKADAIKSYTIGVEALGRGERFDPQADPIVRVEAARVRRALARYFDGEGAGLPVTIEIPRGSYVPVFGRRKSKRSIAVLIALLRRTLRSMQASVRAGSLVRRPPRKRANGAGFGGSSSG
jgi:hypothetical protein